MGCHVWFHNRVEVPLDKAKEIVIENINKSIKIDKQIINRDEKLNNLFEAYPEWTKEYGEECLAIDEKKLLDVENDVYDYDMIMEAYADAKSVTYVPNKGIYYGVEFHNVFRKYNYPEDMLFSLEETLEYINNPDNDCVVYDDTVERLKKFWNKYPDGMIDFG